MGPDAYDKARCGTSNSAGSPANMMTFDRSASGRPGIFGAAARIVTAIVVAAGPAVLPASAQDAPTSPTPTMEAPAATPAPVEAPPAPSATSPSDLPPPTPLTEVPAAAPAAAPAPTTTRAAPTAGTPTETTTPSSAGTPSAPTEAAPTASPDAAAAPDATSTPTTQLPALSADEAAPGAESGLDTSHLPRDLSPWNMFLHADWVVKAVMIGLAFASVVTWTVWLAKSLELTWARRRLTRDYADIHAAASLAEAAQHVGGKKGVVSGLIDMAALELRLSADVPDKDGMKERISSRLDGLVSAAGRDMNKGTGVLATIGSTAPFVGLFGTVWGIYNALVKIGISGQASIDKVAGPVGEALIMTAIGLGVAVPAVMGYNWLIRRNKSAMERVRAFGGDLHNVLIAGRRV